MENTRTLNGNRTEQKKLLMQLKKEMKDLEFKINHTNLYNIKIDTIKNLRIGARALRILTPYILTAGIVTGGFLALDVTPFSKNQGKAYFTTMKEFDATGNVHCIQKYSATEIDCNKIYYYSKWEQVGELYSRNVKVYNVKDLNYEEILKCLDYSDVKLEDVLGEPVSDYKETTNNVDNVDLKKEEYLKAAVYSRDKNDYILKEFTVYENVGVTAAYLLVVIFLQIIPAIYREKFPMKFKDEIENISDKYSPLDEYDVQILKQSLKTCQNNYKTLTR